MKWSSIDLLIFWNFSWTNWTQFHQEGACTILPVPTACIGCIALSHLRRRRQGALLQVFRIWLDQGAAADGAGDPRRAVVHLAPLGQHECALQLGVHQLSWVGVLPLWGECKWEWMPMPAGYRCFGQNWMIFDSCYSFFDSDSVLNWLLTNVSWLMSPSGANMDWTMNLWRFFSFGSYSKGCRLTEMQVMILRRSHKASKLNLIWGRKLPEIWTVCLGSITPEFGLTQYRFGAVVLILKQTLRSDGLERRIEDETWLVKGPEKRFKKQHLSMVGSLNVQKTTSKKPLQKTYEVDNILPPQFIEIIHHKTFSKMVPTSSFACLQGPASPCEHGSVGLKLRGCVRLLVAPGWPINMSHIFNKRNSYKRCNQTVFTRWCRTLYKI